MRNPEEDYSCLPQPKDPYLQRLQARPDLLPSLYLPFKEEELLKTIKLEAARQLSPLRSNPVRPDQTQFGVSAIFDGFLPYKGQSGEALKTVCRTAGKLGIEGVMLTSGSVPEIIQGGQQSFLNGNKDPLPLPRQGGKPPQKARACPDGTFPQPLEMDFDIVFTAVAHPCLTLEKVGQKMTPDLAKIGLEARIIESSWRDFQRLDIGFWAQDENQTEPRWQSLGQISWGENQDGYTPRAKTLEQVLGNDLCSPSLFVFLNQGELAVAKVSFFPYRSSLASYQEFDQEKVPALRYTRTQELLSQFAFFADRLENPQLLKEAVYHLLHKRRNCAWEDSLFVVDGLSLKKTSLKTAEILDLFCQQFDQLIPNQKGKKTAVEEFLNVYENTFNGNPTMAVGCLLKDPGESLAGTSFYGEGYNRFFKRLDNFLKENGLSQDEALHQIARFCNGRFGSQGQRQDQKGFSRFVGYLYQLVDTNIQKLTSLFTPEVKLGDTGFIQDFLLNALPPEFISVTPELLAAEPVWS